MADADGDNSAVEIEVSSTFVIPQPLHLTLVNQQRSPVVSHQVWQQVLTTYRTDALVRWTLQIIGAPLQHHF